jgi:hypothetical protein
MAGRFMSTRPSFCEGVKWSSGTSRRCDRGRIGSLIRRPRLALRSSVGTGPCQPPTIATMRLARGRRDFSLRVILRKNEKTLRSLAISADGWPIDSGSSCASLQNQTECLQRSGAFWPGDFLLIYGSRLRPWMNTVETRNMRASAVFNVDTIGRSRFHASCRRWLRPSWWWCWCPCWNPGCCSTGQSGPRRQ